MFVAYCQNVLIGLFLSIDESIDKRLQTVDQRLRTTRNVNTTVRNVNTTVIDVRTDIRTDDLLAFVER